MKKKPEHKKRRYPSRKVAIAMQSIGMLVLLGILVLQCFFSFGRRTLIYYYFISSVTLGYGVLLRRYHDRD